MSCSFNVQSCALVKFITKYFILFYAILNGFVFTSLSDYSLLMYRSTVILHPSALLNSFLSSNSFCAYVYTVNGTPFQYSCLENPMDGGAWQAAVHGVARSRTRLSDLLSLFTLMHWRRKWQPTPVFLPGESQGRGSLVGCRFWGRTESDMTEVTQQQHTISQQKSYQIRGLVLNFKNYDTMAIWQDKNREKINKMTN